MEIVRKILNSTLGAEEYTLVKSEQVDCYMCEQEKAVEKYDGFALDLGNDEGLPMRSGDTYITSYLADFQPFVYGIYGDNGCFCQDFILCYNLRPNIVDNKIVAYYKDSYYGEPENVVVVDDVGYKIKTSYLLEYLELRRKTLLFDIEFNIKSVDELKSSKKVAEQMGIKAENYSPNLYCRFIFPLKTK